MALVFLIVLYLISSIFSCQKAGDSEQFGTKESQRKKGEHQEYVIDSLRAADRLEDLGKRVMDLLGEPHGVDKFSRNPVYDEYHIKIYQDRLGALNFSGDIMDDLQRFLDKYKGKPQSEFYSYWTIKDIVQKMRFVDEYKTKVERESYSERSTGTERYMLGVYLGEFTYDVSSLINHKEDFWLATLEDLGKMKEEAKKKLELAEKERARLLEEKLRGKK
jgi:hypothetical protein